MIGLLMWFGLASAQPEHTGMVMVAARELPAGVPITKEGLYVVEIPPRYLPADVFLTPELVVGRVPHTRILPNDVVRAGRFTVSPDNAAAEIPGGHRLVEVPILPTPLRPVGPIQLVVPGGCVVAQDAYARGVRVQGDAMRLVVVLRYEDIAPAFAAAASGGLQIAVGHQGERCSR